MIVVSYGGGTNSTAMLIGLHERGEGRLCLILSTASEEEAKRMSDEFYESTLWAHEVLTHCGKGLDHRHIQGRIG